ncbi:MAG: aspartyl protease family protein [Bacteroidota bacterium]
MYRIFLHLILTSFISWTVLWGQPSFKAQNYHEEIPFEWVKGKILVPVLIGGETYQFILDSGGLLMVSERVASRHRLDTVGTIQVSGINKLSETLHKVRVPQVSLGTLSFDDYEAIIGPFLQQSPTECLGADGMIGRDFLKEMIVQYDLAQRKIIFTDQLQGLSLNPLDATPMKASKGRIPRLTLSSSLGKIKNVAFDSGSNDLFSWKKSDASKLVQRGKIADENVAQLYGIFSMGVGGKLPPEQENYRIKMDFVQIGRHQIQNFYTDTGKASGARVGTEIMKYGIITTDNLNQRFYFSPFSDGDQAEPKPSLGFGVRVSNQKLIVSYVIKNSPASQEGITAGVEILQLDGRSAKAYVADYCKTYREGFSWEESKEVEIVYKNEQGQAQSLTLKPFTL